VWRGYGNVEKQTNTNKYTHRHAHNIQGTNLNNPEEQKVGMVMFSISAFPQQVAYKTVAKTYKKKKKEERKGKKKKRKESSEEKKKFHPCKKQSIQPGTLEGRMGKKTPQTSSKKK
jgi:hypothetical protein